MVGQVARPPSTWEVVWQSPWKHEAYLVCVLGLAYALNDYTLAVASTSYCHYVMYIWTYYHRGVKTRPQYNQFQNAVLLYKTVAVCHLVYIYCGKQLWEGGTFVPDHLSLIMIVVGYSVSLAATQALGIDGTYFGIELGFVEAEYCFVKAFPYNCIPHPMITGQIFGLLGIHKAVWVRTEWPWMVPVHIMLYLVHMTQEIYDFWKGEPWYKNTKKRV